MRRSALLFVLPLLAGCDVEPKNPADGDDNVTIHADDSGRVEFNLPIAEGKLKLPGSVMRNGDVDIDGVKLMPGSTVSGFNLDARDKNARVDLGFRSPQGPDAVRAYYVEQFKKQGVEAAVAGDTIHGKTRDGGQFAIQVSPAASGSEGKIVIQDKN